MASWKTNEQPFGVNHAPLLSGLASDGSGVEVPVAVDKDTGELLTSSSGGGGGTSSTFGATFPATGTAVGATDGTNMQPLKVDGSDNLLVKVNAALPAGSNVIGHVITDTGSTTAVTGTITVSGTVGANSATGSAVPANAFYQGIHGPSGNLVGPQVASVAHGNFDTGLLGVGLLANSPSDFKFYELQIDHPSADALSATGLFGAYVSNFSTVYNGTSWDRQRSATAVAGTTGTGLTGAGTLAFDGTNWQYVGINASHALKVDGSAVTQPVSLATNTPTLQSGSTTAVTQATAANLNATVVGTGTLAVQAASTQSGTWTTGPTATTSATGFSISYNSALTNTKVVVKGSAGLLAGWHIYNNNSVNTFIQVFNLATGSVTLGSTAPTFVIVVPPGGWEDFVPTMPGINMGTAITLAATTTASNSTAPANTLIGTFWFI